MKTIILILSTKNKNYDCFKSAIKETWFRDFSDKGIKCLFYEGGSEKNTLIEDTIYLNCDDSLQGTARKLKLALDFIENNFEYDVIYRTNLSSYLDSNKFLSYVKRYKIDSNSYSGLKAYSYFYKEYFWKKKLIYKILTFMGLNLGKKIYFASGSGFFLGKNNVRKILKFNKHENFVDDVMVGLICKLDQIYYPPRIDIGKLKSLKTHSKAINNKIIDDESFHFRFKSEDRYKDCENLKKCHIESKRIEMLKESNES